MAEHLDKLRAAGSATVRPEEHFQEAEAKRPGVLTCQWIPADRTLWRVNRYLDVLAARRELLAEAAQSFLDDLRSGSSAGAAAALRPFTVESEEADDARAVLVKELARVSSTTVTMTPRSTAEASAERMPTWGRAEYVINVSSLSASAITSCATTPHSSWGTHREAPARCSPGVWADVGGNGPDPDDLGHRASVPARVLADRVAIRGRFREVVAARSSPPSSATCGVQVAAY